MYSEIRGINIKQVIWKIILGWKWLFTVSVACAVIFAGFKYISDKVDYEKAQNIESTLTSEQIKNLDNILMQYDRLNYYENYYKDSIVLKIDTKQYDILEIQYYIESEYVMNLEGNIEKDYTPALVSAYGAYVLNSEYANGLINELKLKASVQSVRELTQVSMDKEGAIFKLIISVPTGCDAKKLEEAVDKIVLAKQEDFSRIGEHSIRKINSAVNRTFSDALEKKIYDVKNNINSVRNTIETAKSALSSEQKLYLYNNIKYEEYKNEFASAKKLEPVLNVKFTIVGFVLGLFVVCAIYLIKEVFSNKLQNTDDISSLYKINTIGIVRDIEGAKKKFFVDKILLNIKNKKYKNSNNKDILEYIASKVEMICKIKGVNEIAFVTTEVSELEALEKLNDELKKRNIAYAVLKNILQDANEIKKAKEINNIIIVSELNKSYYSVIEENIMTLRQYDINILGNIVIE